MNDTNQTLRNGRDIIVGISDKNQEARSKVEQTSTIVNQMTRKEFLMKIYIFIAVVLLFIADVLVLIFVTLKL